MFEKNQHSVRELRNEYDEEFKALKTMEKDWDIEKKKMEADFEHELERER